MKSTPMNVASSLVVQSMLKIRTPARMSSAPLRSSRHQLRAICCAASRVRVYRTGALRPVRRTWILL